MAVAGSLTYDTKIDKKGFESGLNSLEGAANSAMKKVVAGVVAVTTAIAGIGTAAVKSYADLEQNIGGIETLFKNSSDKVIKNAENAYKTAGMSANNYMQTVTGFSASLLQSLSGDTEKAADVADMALIDMADNANKMGTAMESIQFAYQGFAKQNYTMLDNLKLGYGGTKEEMQRLLADAQKITGVKYDIKNLNDVFQAIHVIQGELGITGTTAKEAEETITGSVSAMKASWDNFLNGSGTFDQFVESAKTAFDNIATAVGKLLPRIAKEIANTIPESFAEKVKEILPYIEAIGTAFLAWKVGATIQGIVQGVQKAQVALSLYSLQANGANIAQGLFNGSLTLGETLVGLFTGKVTLAQIATAGLTKAQTALKAAMSAHPITLIVLAIGALIAIFIVLWNKCEWFRNFWIGLWENIKNIFGKVKDFILEKIQEICDFFSKLPEKFNEVKQKASEFINNFITAFKNLPNKIKDLIYNGLFYIWDKIPEKFNSVFEAFAENVDSIISIISSIFGAIKTTISTAIFVIKSIMTGNFGDAIEAVKSLFVRLGNIFKSIWENIKSIFSNNLEIIITLAKMLIDKIVEIFNNIKENAINIFIETFNNLKTTIQNVVQNIVIFFEELPYKIGYVIGYIVGLFINFGTQILEWVTTEIPIIIEGIVTFFSELPGKIWEFLLDIINKIIEWGTSVYENAVEWTTNTINDVVTFFSELPGKLWEFLLDIINKIIKWGQTSWDNAVLFTTNLINSVITFFSELPGKLWNFLSDIISKIINWGQTIWNDAKTYTSNLINSVVTFFSELPGKIWNILSDVISKVINWGTNLVNRGREAVQKLVNTVLEKLSELPGKVTDVGRNIVEGLWNGICAAGDWIRSKVAEFASGILEGMKAALGIHSPSRKARDEVGKHIPTGVAEGIKVNTDEAIKAVKKMDNEIMFEMNKAVSIEVGNMNTQASLKQAKEQPRLITNDNGVNINNTQNFYSKESTPYEEQKQAKNQLRRLAYEL